MKIYKRILSVFSLTLFLINTQVYAANINGIDISSYNTNINWNQAKADGVNNVIIKATEGVGWIDPGVNTNYIQAANNNMNIGFYHFFSNYSDPGGQAKDFYNVIRNYNYNITPVLDIETNKLNVNKYTMTTRAIQFLKEFKRISGIDCMIYSYTSFINEDLDYIALLNYKLWIANYSNYCSYPTAWRSNYAGWQFTEKYNISGQLYDANRFTDKIYLDNSAVNVDAAASVNFENIYLTLQRELNRQGFHDKNGNTLNEDGIPGPLTLSALPVVKQGARGNITTWIQLRCGAFPDGVYGPATKQAVIYMQEKYGLYPDGVVGPATWSKLLGM